MTICSNWTKVVNPQTNHLLMSPDKMEHFDGNLLKTTSPHFVWFWFIPAEGEHIICLPVQLVSHYEILACGPQYRRQNGICKTPVTLNLTPNFRCFLANLCSAEVLQARGYRPSGTNLWLRLCKPFVSVIFWEKDLRRLGFRISSLDLASFHI